MIESAPAENPFLRVRLRGVWGWIFVSGIVLAPALELARRLGWIQPRRDLFLLLGAWLYAAPLAWLAATTRRHGISIRRLVGRPKRGWLEAVMIVPPQLLFSAASFMLMIVLLASAFPTAARRMLEQPETMGIAPPGAPRPLVALMLVVIAPIAEELLFRGLLLQTLASRWGFRAAAFTTAAVFAILHANLTGIFVFGLVLTVLYMKSRSLLVPMLCHSVNNLIPFLMALQAPPEARNSGWESLQVFRSHTVFVATITAISGFFMLGYIAQNWPRAGTPMPYDDGQEGAPPAVGAAPASATPAAPATFTPESGPPGATAPHDAAPDDGSTSSRDRSPSPPPA